MRLSTDARPERRRALPSNRFLRQTRAAGAAAALVLSVSSAACVQPTATAVEAPVEQIVRARAESVVPLDANGVTLAVGDSVQLLALDSEGRVVEARWSSRDTAIVVVSKTGLARAKGTGSTAIDVRMTAGRRTTVPVTVHTPSATVLTTLSPGDDIQARVDAAPAGTAFQLTRGVYRLQRVRPKPGNQFVGEPGAVLSGARLLTEFTREGRFWIASGQTQRGQVHGKCQPGYERCSAPEDLFIDDVQLLHVSSPGAVRPGAWHLDYAAGIIYLADDPAGRRVETSVTRTAFEGDAADVTIRGLTIEKYAAPAQHGAVHARVGTSGAFGVNWVVENNVIRWNHGVGVRVAPGMLVRGNQIIANGQLGIGGVGDGVRVEENVIAYNNTAGFDSEWEAGGSKFVRTDGLVVRSNHVHHNRGPGLWTDIDNIGTLYEENTVEDNERAGIFHEISYAAVIRRNVVRRNGFGKSTWLWGAGILVAASPDVEIYDNTVEDNADGIALVQQARGSGAHGPYVVANAYVHGNRVAMSSGQTGLAQDVGDRSIFSDRNNRFEANRYRLSGTARYFAWMDGSRTDAEWKAYGNDVTGEFVR